MVVEIIISRDSDGIIVDVFALFWAPLEKLLRGLVDEK